MERDPNITKLIREGGVEPAPDGFTGKVMDLLSEKPQKLAYKPLIGNWGVLIIFIFLAAIVTVSILFAVPAEGHQLLGKYIAELDWQWPQINISFDFLSSISLSPDKFPTWLISSLAALFILVLIDTRFLKRGLF